MNPKFPTCGRQLGRAGECAKEACTRYDPYKDRWVG
jgi:hypothetical protein